MENNNNENNSNNNFNISDGKQKYYKISVQKFLAAIAIIFVLAFALAGICFKELYLGGSSSTSVSGDDDIIDSDSDDSELLNVLNEYENTVEEEEIDEEEFYNEVDFDYSDFLSGIFSDDYSYDDYYEDETTYEEDCQYNAETAIGFLMDVEANPLCAVSYYYDSYTFLKLIELQADGSYNVNMDFTTLSELVYYSGIYASALKTNTVLSSNINVLSETAINVKDTGVEKYNYVTFMNFTSTSENEFTGYICIETDIYDENGDYSDSEYTYGTATVTCNSSGLVTEATYSILDKSAIPSDILEDFDMEDYDEEDYSDYTYSDFLGL